MTDTQRGLPLKSKLTVAATIDYPHASEILVSFPDQWELVDQLVRPTPSLDRPDTPLYIAGMNPSRERGTPDQFHGLSPEINRALTSYRLYKLFLPWPMPSLIVGFDEAAGTGQVEKMGNLKVQLQPIGQAQAWWGATAGVIWECYLYEAQRDTNWQAELAAFWLAVERDIDVARIFTQPREPTFEVGYTDFLTQLGYAPDPDSEGWWRKVTPG